MITTAGVTVLTQASTLFHWGTIILDWLQRADFLSTKFIDLLRWLFSPTGAQFFFILFLSIFFIVVYRTLFSRSKPEQHASNLVESEQPSEADVELLQDHTKYKSLLEKADEQREDISEYVKLKEVYFCYQYLDAPERLRSVFALDILNKSIFNITIEDVVEGYIKFEGTPLNEKPRIINPPIIAAPANEASITIEQSLTRAEADFIKSQNLQFAEFDLEDLVITITGSEPSEKVQSQPLEITHRQGVVRINKIRKDVDELRSELNKAESEKDKLEKQIEGLNQDVRKQQSNADTLQMCISSRDDELKQYMWLHEIAQAQASDISRYVTLELVRVFDPHSTTPSLRFDFYIRNKSNYHVTIDDKVGGAILFEGKPLTYPLTVIGNELKEFPPLGVGVLAIEQSLRPEEVSRLSEFGDNVYHYFLLNQLRVSIRGGENFPQVQPQRLIMSDLPPEPPAPNVKELKDRIKELERGKAALEKEKSDAVGRLGSELEAVKNQFGWLHKVEDAQARDIDEYVIVESVLLCGKRLDGDPPYIEFWLNVYNMSVFDLTVHKDEIGGRVIYRGERLLEGKEIIYDGNIIPSSKRRHLNVKQYLTQGQADSIAKYDDDLEILLNFQEVDITVSGGTQFPQVRQKRLNMPQSIGTQYMAQLIKTSHGESTDEEAVNASPKLKIEVVQAMYRGYVSQNEGILAMIVNMKVHLTNIQSKLIDIKGFRLRVTLQGIAYLSCAERGEIYESKFKDNKGEIKRGKRLQNLNFNNESPIGIEPEQPVGGWLQFFIEGQFASDADPTPSAMLTVIDALGREYSEDCTLRCNS